MPRRYSNTLFIWYSVPHLAWAESRYRRLIDMSHVIELTRSGGKLLVTGPELRANNVELASPELSVD